jgi:hypothetical protein
MYFALVALLLLILPVASIVTENLLSPQTGGAVLLTGKWFVFWSIGVRLFLPACGKSSNPGGDFRHS